jgi:hypothetical protein
MTGQSYTKTGLAAAPIGNGRDAGAAKKSVEPKNNFSPIPRKYRFRLTPTEVKVL